MTSFVYFVQRESGLIKIGYTTRPHIRLRAIATETAENIRTLAVVPGGRALERHLHDRFAADRERGEWFKPTPELLAEMASLVAGPTQPNERRLPRALSSSQARYARLEDETMLARATTREAARQYLAAQLSISACTLRGIRDGRSAVFEDQDALIRSTLIDALKKRAAAISNEVAALESAATLTERLLAADAHLHKARELMSGQGHV